MKKYVMLLVFLFTLLVPAYAFAEINIDVDYGLAGAGKQDKPIAVTITIQNDEREFDGELITTFDNSYLLQSGKVMPLKLAPNEKVTKKLYVNYFPYEVVNNSSEKFVYLYSGSFEKGKEVNDYRVTHHEPLLASYDSFVIGVFDDAKLANALQQLRAIQQNGLVEISQHEMTLFEQIQQKTDVGHFNSIVLTQELNILTATQQQALLQWVQGGGQLVVDSSVAETEFETYEAFEATSGTTQLNAKQLQQFTVQDTFENGITVKNGQVMNGAQSLEVENYVLAAKKAIGSGALIQLAFSLTDANLLQNDGAAYMMAKLLNFDTAYYTMTPESELSNNIVPVNSLFASFEFSLWKIVLVFALYILLLGPVLYYFLKKKDKREYAWWIIPSLALIVSIALFLIGAKDRIAQPQIQQMAVVKINEYGSQQYFAQSLLSNRGGDYQFELTEDMTATSYNRQATQLRDFKDGRWSYIRDQDGQNTLTLKNVPYWDVESIVGQGSLDVGKLDVSLANENGTVTGTIENHLSFDLTDVQIWTGLELIPIGDLKQGETKELQETLGASLFIPTILPNDQMYYQTPTPATIEENRKSRLLAFAHSLVMNEQSPVLIGYSDTNDVGAKFTNKAKIQSTVLVVQPFTASMNFSDEVTVNGDLFQIKYSTDLYGGMKDQFISGQMYYYLDPADYDVTYQLPQSITMQDITWQSLRYQLNGGVISPQIYNVKTMQYEAITSEFSTSDIADYYKNGQIRFKWRVSEAVYSEDVKLPSIELKGAMKR